MAARIWAGDLEEYVHILLVCPFFPPENTIAAVRIAKFAEHWAFAGHQVTVVARTAIRGGIAIPDHPLLRVVRVQDPLTRASQAAFQLSASREASVARASLLTKLKALVKRGIWPDVYAPWAIRAYRAVTRLRPAPTVVVASVGPLSTLFLGDWLARRFKVPLIVDYRDLYTSGPFYPYGRIRRRIDLSAERRAARRAALVATVSEPMVADLRALHGRETVLVANGYEPDDFADLSYSPTSRTLRITYCGTIYPGRFDATPFLLGVKSLVDADPEASIRVDLYGRNMHEIVDKATSLGLDDVVIYHGEVDHATSLRVQAESDILLLILWNDPRTVGVVSGKLYEYIGARRPILFLGFESGAAADLIEQHQLGLVSNDPGTIAAYLRDAAREKKATGRLEAPDAADLSGFTRASQSKAFISHIERLLGSAP